MIIAWGIFIFGLLGFMGSIKEVRELIKIVGVHDIPTARRFYFFISSWIEILIILCSAQYIWG